MQESSKIALFHTLIFLLNLMPAPWVFVPQRPNIQQIDAIFIGYQQNFTNWVYHLYFWRYLKECQSHFFAYPLYYVFVKNVGCYQTLANFAWNSSFFQVATVSILRPKNCTVQKYREAKKAQETWPGCVIISTNQAEKHPATKKNTYTKL